MIGQVLVRGGATPEELAVVLALVSRGGAPGPAAPGRYETWRAARLAALRTRPAGRPTTR